MATNFKCPNCGRTGKVTDELVGHLVRCDKCKKPFRVEWPDAVHESVVNRAPIVRSSASTEESLAKSIGLTALGCALIIAIVAGPFLALIGLIALTVHSGTWWVIGVNYLSFLALVLLVIRIFSDPLTSLLGVLFALLVPKEEGGGPLLIGVSCLGAAFNVALDILLVVGACAWWFQRDYRTEHVIALVNWRPTPAVAYYRRFSDEPFKIEPIRKKRP